MRRLLCLLGPALALSACVQIDPDMMAGQSQPPSGGFSSAPQVQTTSGRPFTGSARFVEVVNRMGPVASRICVERVRGRSCNFSLLVEDDPSAAANAFQTLDNGGNPVVVFTVALLDEVQNADELAFVLGHEAAHHVAGHIPRRKDQAATGAMIAGVLAQVTGLGTAEVAQVQKVGAELASRQYSKDFELEADALGAEIAMAAGYDAVRGAAFFARLPDPGDRMLGSHPPNAQRQRVVAETVARLRSGV